MVSEDVVDGVEVESGQDGVSRFRCHEVSIQNFFSALLSPPFRLAFATFLSSTLSQPACAQTPPPKHA